jgi:hypothetical protein
MTGQRLTALRQLAQPDGGDLKDRCGHYESVMGEGLPQA